MGFRGITAFLLVLLSLSAFFCHGVIAARKSVSIEEDLELERQLKILNKPAVKTLQVHGEIVDCVDINKQPAFDHPLLKSHKIQMKPSFLLDEEADEASPIGKHSGFSLPNESCPSGTVPIRRTQKKDLINAKTIPRPYLQKNVHQLSYKSPGHHYAIIEVLIPKLKVFGAKAFMSVNNLTGVANDHYSMSQIVVQDGAKGQLNILQVGWAVNPKLYGDTLTRLTTFWTVDGDGEEKTGCFNVLCSGFVQVHPQAHTGMPLTPISVYGGQQYIANHMIRQDKSTGNWWFISADNLQVGYWPKELMTQLGGGVGELKFGGFAVGTSEGPSPPMGNGHYPTRQFKETAYFAQVKYVDESGAPKDLLDGMAEALTDETDCYSAYYYGYIDSYMGHSFTYGGPGGSYCGT